MNECHIDTISERMVRIKMDAIGGYHRNEMM